MVGNFDVSIAFFSDLLYQHYISSWFVVSITKFMQLLDGYNSVALDLDQSRARVNPLEELVRKIEFGLIINKCNSSLSLADDGNMELKAEQHAVTFAIGLPCEGFMPFCVINS